MVTRWRYQQFHPSYLLGWLCGGILLGLLIGKSSQLGASTPLLFTSLILTLGAFRSRRWWAMPCLVLAGSGIGVIQAEHIQQDYSSYGTIVGKNITLQGQMSGDPQNTSPGKQRIALADIEVNHQAYPGEIFLIVYGNDVLKRGDRVEVTGKLRDGFASYGATMSAASIKGVWRGNDVIRDIREHFSTALRAHVIEPMASLGLGFVVGQRSTLPDTLDEQLKIVGLTHIVVASGYNLTILVRFMMRLLARHSRYLAFMCSLTMIIGFVLFSGFSPSMNRAVIVTVLSLLAWYVGRRFHPVLLILYVAAMTAFVNPMYIWADLGWYLSFFAFGGILIVSPLLLKLVYRRRNPSSFEQLVFETMSAQMTALPIIAFAFGTLPIFSLIANVLVAPFIPAAMALTATTGLFGMMSATLAGIIALPTTILIGYMITVVEWLSALPFASYSFALSLWAVCLWYLLLVGIGIYIQRKIRYNFREVDKQLEL